MENYQMNRSSSRPYRTTCGMARPQMSDQTANAAARGTCQNQQQCGGYMPDTLSSGVCMYDYADHMTDAMAYVPIQKYTTVYDPCYALKAGTIFPDLCKPFCGKRGVRR